jgi:hypothetical protein
MTVLVSDLLWDMLSDSHAEPCGFCVSAGNNLPPAREGLAPDASSAGGMFRVKVGWQD